MAPHPGTLLVVGATGSIGRHVVAQALHAGYTVRALVRNPARAGVLPREVERTIGDLTRPETLTAAVAGIDAVIFTHGASGGGKPETVDYAGVRNVLAALDGRKVRIALMTAIGVTDRLGAYNRSTGAHDWKRRSERLVRASGLPYTIVRPGWFDYNAPDQHRLVMLQGDTRHAGTPADGVVARQQIAEVLVSSLSSPAALRKTFELVTETGRPQDKLDALFAALDADPADTLDGVRDQMNMPLATEPKQVHDDLDAARSRLAATAS
ncbi:SDR family oxidoreductase [Ancylobacter sp. WKF20]|uniref:SDR family oxidoreductase n=1 Tax=Ancylobacter sp. WKF20 TaxID=3039801 RepID=UPI00243453E2|nr:SDR family oxidoreductase [Ancylobacter sp. WKF20]WGD32237.1 SDR family oxidoreductase [Ancylobacter sp. WKF20]